MNREIMNEYIEERNRLRDNGCGRNKYLYYTKGYLCDSENFLCDECWNRIVRLSERAKEINDALAVTGEKEKKDE